MRHLPPSVTSDRKHRTTQHTLLTGATRASDVRSMFIVIRTLHPNWWNYGISNYSIVLSGNWNRSRATVECICSL